MHPLAKFLVHTPHQHTVSPGKLTDAHVSCNTLKIETRKVLCTHSYAICFQLSCIITINVHVSIAIIIFKKHSTTTTYTMDIISSESDSPPGNKIQTSFYIVSSLVRVELKVRSNSLGGL